MDLDNNKTMVFSLGSTFKLLGRIKKTMLNYTLDQLIQNFLCKIPTTVYKNTCISKFLSKLKNVQGEICTC